MLNCPNCGYEIFEESKFCPACGSSVKIVKKQEDDYLPNSVNQYDPFSQKDSFGIPVQKQDPFSQPDPFKGATFNNRQNSYNLFEQSYWQPVPRTKNEKHIIFVFVTALIFMIMFISRSLFSLILISDLQYFKNNVPNAYIAGILDILCIFIACAALIIFFIFACSSKNTGKDIQKRIRSSEILYIFSITVFLLEIVYLAAEIYFVVVAGSYYLDNWLTDQLTTILITHPAFITFFVINIVKSSAFKRDLRRKLEDADNSKISQ